MDFSLWTRQDFLALDTRRNEVMQATPAEIETQSIEQENARLANINSKLSALSISRPQVITKEFVIWMLTNMKAEEFIGQDFSGWVDNQEVLFGSLEVAFDDLVIRYL